MEVGESYDLDVLMALFSLDGMRLLPRSPAVLAGGLDYALRKRQIRPSLLMVVT